MEINIERQDVKLLVNNIWKMLNSQFKLLTGLCIHYSVISKNLEQSIKYLILVVLPILALIFSLIYFAIK